MSFPCAAKHKAQFPETVPDPCTSRSQPFNLELQQVDVDSIAVWEVLIAIQGLPYLVAILKRRFHRDQLKVTFVNPW